MLTNDPYEYVLFLDVIVHIYMQRNLINSNSKKFMSIERSLSSSPGNFNNNKKKNQKHKTSKLRPNNLPN